MSRIVLRSYDGRVAVLAYLLLPISGLAAYLLGRDARIRFHGLQAIALGLVWALSLYGASALSPRATRVVFGVGAAAWLGLIVAVALGRRARLPLVGRSLERAARDDPRG
jgi:uncharacterized membrane protein